VAAHPIEPLDITKVEDDDGMMDTKILDFLTVKALEADLQKEFPGKGFSARIGFGYAFNPKTAIGYNKTSYALHGEKGWVSRTYLLRKVEGLWRVERALEDGEKVNTKTGKVERFVAAGGKTLNEAVAKGDPKLVALLLKNNADVNAKDTKGTTPLVAAVAGGYEKIVEMLIDRGADVNAAPDDGRIPLHISVARGDLPIVKLLIDAKADVNIANGHGGTALHTAAVWDRHKIAEMLIKGGADVNAIDDQGNSALDLARWWSSEKTAKLLKANGAKIAKASNQAPGLMGRVRGMEMVDGQATIDTGRYVHFYGSKGRMNPPVVTIYLNTTNGVLPIGRSFKVNHDDTQGTGFVSNALFKFSTETKGRGRSDWLRRQDYDLELTFGDEKDGMLQGEILLNSPQKDVRLKGTFAAKMTGLRIVDGHPDIHSDSFETLRYAVKLYLQDKLGEDKIEVSDAGGNYSGWYSSADKVGAVDVKYIVGDDSEQFLRAQLRKGKDGWKVARQLKGNQLLTAHPLGEVDKEDLRKYFLFLASRKLEKELQQEYPDSNFRTELRAPTRTSRNHGLAQVDLKYWVLGTDKPTTRKYLLRQTADDWTVERTLTNKEKLNTTTGKIEKN
jgi:hypothetical protein